MSATGDPGSISKPGTILGKEAKPPFAVLADPSVLFLARFRRLAALAPGHELAPYLTFLAALTKAQHDIQEGLPSAKLPPVEHIGQALEHGMPPIPRTQIGVDDVMDLTIVRLLAQLTAAEVPPQTAVAIEAVRGLSPAERCSLVQAVLRDAAADDLAQRTLIAAGLQVHFVRMAAMLTADDLRPVADGVCPACGSAAMTSSVVGWPKAHNTRFCTCSLCATMWNVVRVKCVLCGSTEGVSYRTIEGKPDTVKAETCDKCRGYVKILYQVNDPALEAMADDVASLGLDMLLVEEGWKRGGQNPFLLGY
jgi:FdhE protein